MKQMDEVLSFFKSPVLSDEEWDAHDEEIRRKRQAESEEVSAEAKRVRMGEFQDRGFPLRALQAAVLVDETKPALARLAKWNPAEDSMIVLSGPAGCGKTVAAVWWAWHKAPWPMFLRSTTLAASSRYDREERASWLGAKSLVLDDLGTEYADSKGNYQVDLDELFDVFYGDRKPLIITTNCTKDEFAQRYGARVMDRLRECGSWASIKGESLRGKQ
jgi:DNA replication protein DnaC